MQEKAPSKELGVYWAVTELGLAGTAVGKRLGFVQSALSKSVERVTAVADRHDFRLED